MKITYDGLLAGVRYLNEHCDGFDIGTGDDYRTPFIHELLTDIFRASGIEIDIDVETQHMQKMPVCEGHQDTLQLSGLVVFLADVHLENEAYRRLFEEVHGSTHSFCCLPFPRIK